MSVARMGTVEAGPYRIHHSVHGDSGAPLILLHGGGPGASGSSNFGRNIDALAARHRVHVIDFPGWGRSSKNLGPGNPFINGAHAVLAYMDAVGLAKAHLVGNSFGGSAALYAAMMRPERVDRLVLMGPGGALIPGEPGPTEGIMQLLTYYNPPGPTPGKLRAFIGNLVHDQSAITDAVIAERFAASIDPEIVANPPLRLPPAPPPPESAINRDPRLATLPHRVQMLWGLDDQVNPWRGALTFYAIPDFELVLLPRCGHWVQWEYADKFNDLVLAFLARNQDR